MSSNTGEPPSLMVSKYTCYLSSVHCETVVVHKHISTRGPQAFFKSQSQAQNLGPKKKIGGSNILEALDVITSTGAKTQVESKLCECTPVILAGDRRQKGSAPTQ